MVYGRGLYKLYCTQETIAIRVNVSEHMNEVKNTDYHCIAQRIILN